MLRKVAVQLAIVQITFQELALNQRLNALFDQSGRGQESGRQLACDLSDHAIVIQRSPRLHDAHYGCLYLRLAVLLYLCASKNDSNGLSIEPLPILIALQESAAFALSPESSAAPQVQPYSLNK